MARNQGSARIAASLEVEAGAPLDARLVVPLKTDLTSVGTYPYKYKGMIVSVQEEGKAYMLIGTDPTDADNWKPVGSGEGGDAEPLTPEELEELKESFDPEMVPMPTIISPEDLQRIKESFVIDPLEIDIPEDITMEEAQELMDEFQPNPPAAIPEMLTQAELERLKSTFIINPLDIDIPEDIDIEEMQELEDAFILTPPAQIPEKMTQEELEAVKDAYDPIPISLNIPEPLTSEQLQRVKDAFVIN